MSERDEITLQPSGGEKETVKAGVFDVADEERPLAQKHGAGCRAVYDLGRPERSVFVVSTGQSGNPLSSHYEDSDEPWRDGRYLPMLTDRARVEEDALGTLVLTPRCVLCPLTQRARLESIAALTGSIAYLLIHESPLTDTLFLLVSKSDEVTTT